jgi:hypothetical protein
MKYIFEDEDVTDARLDIEADNQQEAWKKLSDYLSTSPNLPIWMSYNPKHYFIVQVQKGGKLVWDLFDAKGEDCPF